MEGAPRLEKVVRIGVDWGGSKIEAALLDEGGRIVQRLRVPTKRDDYEDGVTAVASLVGQLQSGCTPRATVGVGIPGMIHPQTGLVKNANSTWLIGKPLQRDLEAELGYEIRCENDANCFTRSEAVDGAAAGADVVFGVILGTGCGGGVAVRKEVLSGRNNIAGEWGHNPLPRQQRDEYPGPLCYCGRDGCIETWLSGPALEGQYRAMSGKKLAVPEIAALAINGDPVASLALERYENRLARGLASIVILLDPDIIVLGGGLSNIRRLYENVPKLLPNYVFGDQCETPIVPPLHGDSSGARGAAWLWP